MLFTSKMKYDIIEKNKELNYETVFRNRSDNEPSK